MCMNYDRHGVQGFITNRINLHPFCTYLFNKFQHYRQIDLDRIKFKALPHGVPMHNQVIHLIGELDNAGFFADFVIHLINFWFEEVKGAKKEVKDIPLHKDLCLAAQEIWGEEEQNPGIKTKLRELAQQAFNRLSKLDRAFGTEWKEAGNGTALEKVEKFEPHRNLEDLTTFFKESREQYQRAQKYIDELQLLEARETFFQLDNQFHGYSNTSDWVKRLEKETEVRGMQTLIDSRESGFVYDDRLPWATAYPYRLFRQLNSPITPDSSMNQVREEFQRLRKQKGGISEENRDILETLAIGEVERLFVDAFYYPVRPTEKTILAVTKKFIKTGKLPTPRVIKTQYPREAAILLFLLGHHREAEETWKKEHIKQPLEGSSAHGLGLFYLGNAYDAAGNDPQKRVSYWRAAIAHWAVVLANTAYWVKWGNERFQRYGADFVFAAVSALKSKIKLFLDDLLELNQEKDNPFAGDTKELKLAMEIEFRAVYLTHTVGGIQIGEGRAAWFGPLWMSAYQMQGALAGHIASLQPLPGQESLHENFIRLRRYFSHLGTPAIRLEGADPDPEESLNLLYQPGLPKKDCGDALCPVHGKQKFPLQVHCRAWEEFDYRNPAYKALDKPVTRMCEDALDLAVAAHWTLAKKYILEEKLKQPELVEEQWKKLLKTAGYGQNPANIRQWLRGKVLAGTTPIPEEMDALDAAIKIIEMCLNALSESYTGLHEDDRAAESEKDNQLEKRLAELLSHRGMKKLEQENISSAEVSLKKALSLAPHIHSIRINLALLLMGKSVSVMHRDLFQSQEFLRQADGLIKTGKNKYKGFDYRELQEQLAEIRQNLSLKTNIDNTGNGKKKVNAEPVKKKQSPPPPVTSELAKNYAKGIRELREGRPGIALGTFEKALTEAPEDYEIQKIIPTALMEYALKLCGQDRHDEALELVNQWLQSQRLPSQENQLMEQQQFLKWWPELFICLDDAKDLNYTIYEYRQVHLFPLPPYTGHEFQFVKVTVEGDCLMFDSLLPPIPDTEKTTALLNLLQASDDTMFKLVYSEKPQLALKWSVPFPLITPGWFNQTAVDLFEFSNMTVEEILDNERITRQFREIEARSHQRHPGEHLSQSAKILKKVCGQRELQCDDLTDVHYEVHNRGIEIKIQGNGTRFYTSLGTLRQRTKPRTKYKDMVEFNTRRQQCKLSLDKEMNVIYTIPLPRLDESSASAAVELLEKYRDEMKTALTDSHG